MKLEEIYSSPQFSSRPGDDQGERFDLAFETGKERTATLAPEDRTVKPTKFLYVGEQPFTFKHRDLKADVLREAGSDRNYAMTDGALKQLASRIGPDGDKGDRINFPGYIRACDEKLRVLNMNAWMQKNGGKPVLMRTVRPFGVPVLRGVLSDSYVQVDDFDLLGLLSGIPDAKRAQLRWMEFGEDTTHLRMTWKEDRREIAVGDVVEFGVHVSNSEIGHRAIRVEPIIYRLRCANGMISGGEGGDGSWYIRHQGNRDRVRGAVQEAISEALPAARDLAAKFSATIKEHIDKPAERLMALGMEENLTEAMVQTAIAEMLGEAKAGRREPTRFDFINGLTGAGRQQTDSDKRYTLERLGAKMVTAALPLPLMPKESKKRR